MNPWPARKAPCPPLGMLKEHCYHHHARRDPGCPCRGPYVDCFGPPIRRIGRRRLISLPRRQAITRAAVARSKAAEVPAWHGPWIGPAVNLEAVPHAQRHRPAINAPQVAPESVAVPEAVGNPRSPLAANAPLLPWSVTSIRMPPA
jgi:hypothetical protein